MPYKIAPRPGRRQTRLRPSQGGRFAAPVGSLAADSQTRAPAPRPPATAIRPRAPLAAPCCVLCASPTLNARQFAVGAPCADAHTIRSRWTAAYAAAHSCSSDPDRECFCPGWLFMNEEHDGSLNIERCDACDLLFDDSAAAEVALCLAPTPTR